MSQNTVDFKEEVLDAIHKAVNDYTDYQFDYDENRSADFMWVREIETYDYFIDLEMNVTLRIDGNDEIISREVTVCYFKIWRKEQELDEKQISNQEIINQLTILNP